MQNLESSNLLIRPSILVRHRRITGALWFGTCAFVAALIVNTIMHRLGEPSHIAFIAALSALLPGLIFGAQILDQRVTKSAWGAAGRGAAIVVISHIAFTVLFFLPTTFTGPLGYSAIPVVLVLGLIFGGWVTIPAGCTAAIALYKLRDRNIRTRGCAIHGYRG